MPGIVDQHDDTGVHRQFLAAGPMRPSQHVLLHRTAVEDPDPPVGVTPVGHPEGHLLEQLGVLLDGGLLVVVVVPDHGAVGVDVEQVAGVTGLGRDHDAIQELYVLVLRFFGHAGRDFLS